ncbi:hypothetical protein EDB92DRAFT_1953617 [Lactarius akahatsu]|uniref:Uncharacterized protein n=1 Tax=Lactarius akahatsu TaxID=416441 RepID=A0AAD4L9F8_9AGAM|nr:hypothetical protein EDB92DRAFT_1953617 [Lactarius akahatsu]
MSNLFSGLSTVTNTVSASGMFPTSLLNQKPTEGSQPSGLLSQATGLLSHTPDLLSGGALDWAMPKPPIVWDASFKQLIFAILLLFLSFVRGFVPPFIWGFLLLGIPPFISFYELTLRRFLPQLPSTITIAFQLYKDGLLTMSTITWLLPQSMIGGLGAVGGIAMGGTAVLAGGATALVGGATSFAGEATALVGGATALAGEATALVGGATAGAGAVVGGVVGLAGGATNTVTQGITGVTNLVGDATNGIQAAVGNTNAIAGAAIQSVTNPVAAIGATQAAMTEGATKLAHALDSVNPLSNLMPNAQSQQGVLGNMLHPKLPGFA